MAPRKKKNFAFTTHLVEIDILFIRTAIILPSEIVSQLPPGRVRVRGTMNGAAFALAVQHIKDGSRYFSVSAALRKAAGITTGDRVNVRFSLADPNALDMPEELDAVLAQDEEARQAWEALTIGYRRGLIHYVTSVRNVDSRIKRSIELLEKAKHGLLHGQRKKPR